MKQITSDAVSRYFCVIYFTATTVSIVYIKRVSESKTFFPYFLLSYMIVNIVIYAI